MMDASLDAQSPSAQVNPSHIMAKRPSHSRQAHEWATVDYRYGMPMPITSASDRYSSAPSSTSSNSVDLPSSSDGRGLGLKPGPAAADHATLPPRSNSLGGQPSGVDHSGTRDPVTSTAAFADAQYPFGFPMEDHHEYFNAQPLPPRSMSRDLSGQFQRLDTGAHSDGSSSSSALDPSRRNSVASYSPTSSGIYLTPEGTANGGGGLGVSLQASPASATFGGPQPYQQAPHAPPRRESTLSMSHQFLPETTTAPGADHSSALNPPTSIEPRQLRATSSGGLANPQRDMVVTSSQVSPRLYTSSSMPQMSNLEHAPSGQHLFDPSWSFTAPRPAPPGQASPALPQAASDATGAWTSVPQ